MNEYKRAVIICNGSINAKHPFYNGFFREDDYIICADGGVKHVEALGVEPHAIVGDMDSIPPELRKRYKNKIHTIVSQDNTDSEKAVIFAINKGFEEMFLLGVDGNRPDQQLANYFLLEKYSDQDIKISDEFAEIFYAHQNTSFATQKGDVISLMALRDVEELQLEGLEYTVDRLGHDTRGVHNIATGDKVSIRYGQGDLLVFRIRDQNQ